MQSLYSKSYREWVMFSCFFVHAKPNLLQLMALWVPWAEGSYISKKNIPMGKVLFQYLAFFLEYTTSTKMYHQLMEFLVLTSRRTLRPWRKNAYLSTLRTSTKSFQFCYDQNVMLTTGFSVMAILITDITKTVFLIFSKLLGWNSPTTKSIQKKQELLELRQEQAF